MATSRPLPPGRRGKSARPPAAAMRALPEPRLLGAPSAPAFPAKEAPKPAEHEQKQPPHETSAFASPRTNTWGQRASQPAAVANPDGLRAPSAARMEAAAPSPAQVTPPKASGFLAARAMFDAKKAAAPPPLAPAPLAKPSRFGARPLSIATGSSAHGQTSLGPTPKSPVAIPEPPTKQAPSSVKALISRLNSPAAVAKAAKPPTEHLRPSPRLSHVNKAAAPAAIGSQQPEQRTPPPAPETTTPAVTRIPTPEPISFTAKVATGVESIASVGSSPTARLSASPARAPAPPAPRVSAPPVPITVPQVRPTAVTSPAVAPPVPPTVTAPVVPTTTATTVPSPPPVVALPPAHSPVATDTAASSPAFHPFNLLLSVTAVPTIPRKLDCVYDDAAAEMQKNIMKVVKKLFRKTKPRVEEFKINAKLYGNGFMDAEEYLDSLIKDFRALRALQLVPCLVSIQHDDIKRDNLLFAARGYRLRNLDALQRQCDQLPSGPAIEQRPRLSSSDSVASTVSTVSTVSVAVDSATPVIAKDPEQEKKPAVASEPLAAAVDVSSTKQVESSAHEHEAKGNNTIDTVSSTTAEPLAPEPVSEPMALVSESPELLSKVEPGQENALPPRLEVAEDDYNKDASTGSTGEIPVSAPADTVDDVPATTEADCGATESGEAKAENALSEADTDSDSSAADPVASPSVNEVAPAVSAGYISTPPVLDVGAQVEEGPSPHSSNQDLPSQSTQQGAEPEAGPLPAEEAVPQEKSEPEAEQQDKVEPLVKPPSDAVAATRPSRADSLTSSDDEEEDAPANAFQCNMFGEVVTPKEHQVKQQVEDHSDAGKAAATAETARPVFYEAESLFGGIYEPIVAVQATSSTSVASIDTSDAFSLFGPSSATSSPARSPSSAGASASSSKPRKSVTWGTTQAKEIPARRSSPPPAPMIFGFATAGAYSDSDSDDDSDFD